MPKYTIDGTTLSDVADAVRELDGNPDTMTPAQMASRIRAVQPGGADLSVIADDYDTTATYDVGDYCIHEGGLYVCTTAISTAEAWTAGHWQEVTVGGELTDVKSDLNQKYEKPSTGIPASDLASGVIPDVSGFYTKPSGGIPLTDLASNAQNVSGTTPSITGVSGMRYICGEVSTLSITPPASGIIDVIFTSGSTPTVLTVPSTVKFPEWFDPTSLVANTTYEINIADGVYGAVMAWT